MPTVKERYEAVAERMLEDPRVRRSTMMGYLCLRLGGRFFVSLDARADAIVVKLPRQRVRELIEEGVGDPFAPAGRVFGEWVSLPPRAWMRGMRSSTRHVCSPRSVSPARDRPARDRPVLSRAPACLMGL
jgi:hypothetical protein